jgi:hypothetical protein
MPFEGRQRAALLECCWSIYFSLTSAFADNLPFHRTDHRKRLLTHPPHHMHDQRGRVFSFSGDVHHFIADAKTLISSR